MDNTAVLALLKSLHNHDISVDIAADKLKNFSFEDIGFAKVDHHRAMRRGHPEVIFCQNKTTPQIIEIAKRQIAHGDTVLGTRASPEALKGIKKAIKGIEINESGRCFWHKSKSWKKKRECKGSIVLITAGTADMPVAEEARTTIEVLGHPCIALYDIGVAGIHRLYAYKQQLADASVIIAIAGMEGALPSVVTGLVSCPVIGVPTSVGYGAHLNGFVPLLSMLTSCASGLTVVNIDNGFGAAFAATLMNTK